MEIDPRSSWNRTDFTFSVGYGRYTKKLSKDYQDALAAAAESASESMSNARIMHAFSS
jgi:hypothetical protein